MSNIDPMLMRQIIMDHYDYPRNKELTKDNGYMSRHMASDSCIDDITVQTKISHGAEVKGAIRIKMGSRPIS